MDKADHARATTASNNMKQLRSHSLKNPLSTLVGQLELKMKPKAPQSEKKISVSTTDSIQDKLGSEKLGRWGRSKVFHKGEGDNQRTPIKANISAPSRFQRPISKGQSSSAIVPAKKQPTQTGRFLGIFPKLESKIQTNSRPRSKPLQNIQLRTSLSFKDNSNHLNSNESSHSSNKLEKRNSKSNLAKPKAIETPKVNKSSPYKSQQLPSIFAPGNRPRSRQVKDTSHTSDEMATKPPIKLSSVSRLDKFESMYHETMPKVDVPKCSLGEKVQKGKQIRLKGLAEVQEPAKEKFLHKSHVPGKQQVKAVGAPKTNNTLPLTSPVSSRDSSDKIATNGKEAGESNFEAVLLLTNKVIQQAMESTTKQLASDNVPSHSISESNTEKSESNKDAATVEENVPRVDNIDNLPYPIDPELGGQGRIPENEIINPPVNTPVSPRSPISDPTDTDSPSSDFMNKASYSDEEDKSWVKHGEMDHDFVSDYLQLESLKDTNSITQAICRANICGEVKGADPNLTLEELKHSKSHYLQMPCFSDPKFFTKIKIPAEVFMSGKKPDKDLITIQYLQEKMDRLYQNNLKAYETLKKSKESLTPVKEVNVDTTLSKERYIQSLSKLFQSLQFPQWAKECFGPDEEGINLSPSPTEEEVLTKSLPEGYPERSAIAKRILNLFETGNTKRLNAEKSSRLKKAALPKDCDDDTSSDNVSESP